jgi:hypothetical protein
MQRQQDAGVDVRKKSMTVANLANEWLTHLEQNEGTKEEGTILRLRPRVKKHIIPADRIGGRQLDQLTVTQVEAWLRREALPPPHRRSSQVPRRRTRFPGNTELTTSPTLQSLSG